MEIAILIDLDMYLYQYQSESIMKAKSKSAKKHIKKDYERALTYQGTSYHLYIDLEQRMHAFYALFANFSFRNKVCGF